MSYLRVETKSRRWIPLTIRMTILLLAAPFGLHASEANPRSIAMPVVFEKNLGQALSSYDFLSRHSAVEALFSDDGVDLLVPSQGHSESGLSLRLIGAQPHVVPEGRGPLSSVSNYLIGADPRRWLKRVANNSELVYPAVYPGIDLIFRGNGQNLEHDFRIAPGANPELVKFRIIGADVALSEAGDLLVSLGANKLLFRKPVSYQESSSGRQLVQSAFVLDPDRSIHFRLGAYDHKRELVIDPIFNFSTYLDGTETDVSTALTTDPSGNIYVAGYTYSTDFPIVNGIQTTSVAAPMAFVSKLDPTGHTLLYSTYLGGADQNQDYANYASAVAVDPTGNIIVAGTSSSSSFPQAGSVPPPPSDCGGTNQCYFLVSLTPDGSTFNYAGLIGGREGSIFTGNFYSGSLAVDSSGNAYLAGVTDSSQFEITPGTLTNSVPSDYDSTFVLKADSTGALVYSTIVPGNVQENIIDLADIFFPVGVAVDSNGQATVAGSGGPGLPTTPGVIGPSYPTSFPPDGGNPSAGFVFQINPTASAINYATYVPGGDVIGGLAVDNSGNTYLAGGTAETDLPVSGNAYQKTLKSGSCNDNCLNGFILKLDGAGKNVLAATYLSGTPTTYGGTSFSALALDSHSNVYVGGMTTSQDFPLVDPFVSAQQIGETTFDMVLAEMTPSLNSLLFGSFLSSTDQITDGSTFSALTVDPQDNPIVTGGTSATDFPTTAGSYQTVPQGNATHLFVSKFNMTVPAPSICLSSWNIVFSPLSGPIGVGSSGTQTVTVTNCGNAALSIKSLVSSSMMFKASDSCGSIQPGAQCPISIVFSPESGSMVGATITLTDNAAISPQYINVSGQGVANLGLGVAPGGSASATVAAGSTASYSLSIGGGGFSGTATITCSGAPQGATCNVPAPINVSATTATAFNVSVSTTSRTTTAFDSNRLHWNWLAAVALLGMFGTAIGAKRKRRPVWLLDVLLFSVLLLVAGCGGGSNGGGAASPPSQTNPNGTPAGTYQLTVTAKLGNGYTEAQSLQLVVQ